MKLIRTIYTLGLLVGLFASCSKESPLDGEHTTNKFILWVPMKWYSNLMWRMAMVRKMRMLPLLREVARISTGMWKSS